MLKVSILICKIITVIFLVRMANYLLNVCVSIYSNLLENMKKYISTLYQNTDPYTSVRISISYYSRTRTKSPRILAELLMRVGNLVVVIGLPREATLSRTLRAMLTHLVAFPITLNRMIELNRILVSRTDLQHHAFLTPRKPLEIVFPDPKKRPRFLHSLMESLASLMENFSQSALPDCCRSLLHLIKP